MFRNVPCSWLIMRLALLSIILSDVASYLVDIQDGDSACMSGSSVCTNKSF